MTAPLIEVAGVTKLLAGRRVVDSVSFDCPAGAVTALLGPNGAGKTTTVGLVCGTRRPDAGRVLVAGAPAGSAAARRLLALVPQDIGFPPALGVGTCLALARGQRRTSRYSGDTVEILERLGVAELTRRRIGGLSGGQRRRLALALALAAAPPVLVLDEATTNLDEHYRARTWELLREHAERGGCVLVTSHILADIDRHADRVVALADGRVTFAGGLAEVRTMVGGHSVEVAVPAARRDEAIAAGGAQPDTEPLPASPGRLRWHSHDPAALVAALVGAGLPVTDLVVEPVPLADVLEFGLDDVQEERCR